MIEAQANEQFEAVYEGAPGLAGMLGVQITDPIAETVVVPRTTAGVNEYPPGSGIYAKLLIAPGQTGSYTIVWDDGTTSVVEELRVVAVAETVGGAGYPTTAELVAGSADASLLALDSAQQDALRIAAISAVERYTGQSFAVWIGLRTFDGDGSRVIYLPQRLAELDTLVVARSALTAGDVVLSDDHDRLHTRADLGLLNYYERALWDLSDDPDRFTNGPGTVQITGSWGWKPDEYPPSITTALRLDMEDNASGDNGNEFAARMRVYQQLGIKSASQGDVRFDFANAGDYPPVVVSDRVKAILDNYIWPGVAGRRL